MGEFHIGMKPDWFLDIYLFQKVPCFLGEVRWKVQFALQDFVYGFFPILCSEWWLKEKVKEVKEQSG